MLNKLLLALDDVAVPGVVTAMPASSTARSARPSQISVAKKTDALDLTLG